MRFFVYFWALTGLIGCASSSISAYRLEGEGHIKKIIRDLQGVESTSDLLAKQRGLKKEFAALVDLMIESAKSDLRYSEDKGAVTSWELELSECLKNELIRIYEMDGGAEIIEEALRDSLHKLDLFQKMHE